MLTLHYTWLLFGGVVLSVCSFILGQLDAPEVQKDTPYYTPEEDAYWAEWVRVHNQRIGGK